MDNSQSLPVIVMESVDGRPLSVVVQEKSVPAERARPIVRQIAEGMNAAHDMGIVHGDLKPSNIMLTRDESAKITDFGLSRREVLFLSSDETGATGLSDRTEVAGTPNYMSPEQTNGKPATMACDVFALGLLTYEILTGRKAFSGDNILQVFHRIREIDPKHYAAAVPEPFSELVASALVPNYEKRTLTMGAIAEALA